MSTNRNPTTERKATGKPGKYDPKPRKFEVFNEVRNGNIVRDACEVFLLASGQVPAKQYFRGNFGRNAE